LLEVAEELELIIAATLEEQEAALLEDQASPFHPMLRL